jgi:hypothetical protein
MNHLIVPLTQKATSYIRAWGRFPLRQKYHVVVEPRYLFRILLGMTDAGLRHKIDYFIREA